MLGENCYFLSPNPQFTPSVWRLPCKDSKETRTMETAGSVQSSMISLGKIQKCDGQIEGQTDKYGSTTSTSGCLVECRICSGRLQVRISAGATSHQGLLSLPSLRVGKWVPAAAGKAKSGMAHSDCGWTFGRAGKTVKSLENTCHTWALLRWCFTKRLYFKCLCTFTFTFSTALTHRLLRYWLQICGFGWPPTTRSRDTAHAHC